MSKMTTRLTALLLSGMLVIGSVPGSVLAASTDVDLGQTSEIAQEVYEEESSEAPATDGEIAESEETSEDPVGAGETAESEETSETPTDAEESLSEAASPEEAQYYNVTLDANGGYFENEWDDAIGDYAQQAEVVEKHIPGDGSVAALPVFVNQDGKSMVFAGWSMEPEGELVSLAEEKFVPVDNCVLYAVWQAEDVALGETEGQEATDEGNIEQADAIQESEEVDAEARDCSVAEEGAVEEDTVSDSNIDSETENEQDIVSDQEAVSADEENISEESSDAAVDEEETQLELNDSLEEEETIREDAAKDIVESGTCGDNLTWTLDDKGTLTISGQGEMEDYKHVGNLGFSNAPWGISIKRVTIENGATSIGENAFLNCNNLTSIAIPSSVTRIGSQAFCQCENLASITIPSSVTSIGAHAFFNCWNLTSVIIPESVTSIESGVFSHCTALTSITIPESVTNIGDEAFYYCSLTSITIPESVTSIGDYAFEYCGNLTSITIPKSVTGIGNGLFYKCSSLTNIAIPSSVMSIGEYAFSGCTSLSCITIPRSVTSIGKYAFEFCRGLTSITIPESVTSIGFCAFSDCRSLTNIAIPSSVTKIGGQAFSYCESLTSITIPESVKSIEDGVFSDCSSLTSISIPESVTSIEGYAFIRCSKLTSITIPESVTTIGESAFADCHNLTSITIPESVRSIGAGTFCNCNSLTSISIPKSVTSIDYSAFSGCISLSTIYFNGNAPSISSTAFTDVTATAYYPANDPTWTEDVRQNYGGNITWELWDPGTDPIIIPDPDSFFLSIGTPTCNAVVLGKDGLLSALAWYDFNNPNTALQEAQQIRWTCSDPSAVEIYDPEYSIETKNVRISLRLRGKKPGSYTITGTAPDGRTASEDVVVEPEIVAVSDMVTITETTDVVMVKATLNSGNKGYLTSFLNSVTYRLKDDFGAFAIQTDDSKRVEITEDGKTGKLILTMAPIYGGSCEFTLTSPGGQQIVEKVYSGLNDYPWETPFSPYTWSFGNYEDCPLSIQNAEYNKFTKGMYPVLRRFIDKKVQTSGDGGVCYGLSASSVLVHKNKLALDEIEPGLSTLYNAKKTPKAKSIISFYQLNQYSDMIVAEDNYFQSLSTEEQLEFIEQEPMPFVILFQCESWGAHAMVGYRIESGSWNISHNWLTGEIDYHSSSGGTEYNRRLLTYDSNSEGLEKPEGSYLYYNTNTKEWEIPNYYDDDSARQSSKKDGFLRGIHSDPDLLAAYGADAFRLMGTWLWGQEEDFSLLINGEYKDVSVGKISDNVTAFYDIEDENEATNSKIINVRTKNDANWSVLPKNNAPLDISAVSSGYFFSAKSDSYNSACFNISGGMSAEGIAGSYALEITSNEENSAVPYYSFTIEGNDAGDISIDLQDDGLHISGENLEDVTVIGENDDTSKELNISTNADDVLVIGDENGLQGLIDPNNDGVFDQKLTNECLITTTPISSIANANGIEIELDKGSYAVQEGDVLTIDATIKTDKERVEGQNEYIGYFAYYANKQWNQLASWDIEGGTTKYRLKQKIANWPKYDELVFTVSVFPKNSFIQGSALIDKMFLVDVTQKEYVITLDPNGGSVSGSNVSVKKGNAIGVLPVPSLEGYLFEGWYTGIYSGYEIISTSVITDGSIKKLYARWKEKTSVAAAQISGFKDVTYTGKAVTFPILVTLNSKELKNEEDYTSSYTNNTNVGTATVTITGKGSYTGTVSKTFTISAASIANATVSGISNKTYTGSAITQNPTVKVGDKTLTKNTDYTVSYQNNTNVGTATVTITGKGNYASKKTATFKINKAAQSITAKARASRVAVGKTTTVSITGNKGKKSYKSSNTAIATVTSAGKVTAKKVGTVKITATSAATANYNAASKTVTIKVVPAATASLAAANQVKGIKLTWKKVTGANGYKVYRGSTLIKTITSGSTVTFTDTRANTNGTKYTYKVVAKATTGDSTLSKSRVIYRVSRPAISSVTNSASKKMTVKWGKNAKANGYQIQYSTDKTFKTGNKAVSITSASTVSKVIGSLTKGKTYYVRIRTYKTVGSTKYWSIWSAARSVKISK